MLRASIPSHIAIVLAISSMLGCSDDNQPPVLAPLTDQQAFVNVEMVMALSAADAEGDVVSFRFESALDGVTTRSSIQDVSEGRAVFRWTPLASDFGSQTFDFVASDGSSESRATVAIEVSRSAEGAGTPIFIQPLGTGTTLDAATQSCLDIPIVIEDPDSTGVTLAQEEPVIVGASVQQEGELSGSWTFCPSDDQLASADRFQLVLSADDFESPKTLKDYLIVIRQENKPGCPGEAPVVSHSPENVSSVNDVTIRARVTDDIGIKYEPLLYYSESKPADPPDVTQMTQLTMALDDGDMSSGMWSVAVPNPVANQGAGATAQLFYVIVAQDNDDTEGTCDHLTQVPAQGSFEITVDNPGGGGGLGLCEVCTADVQCGGDGDLCVFLDNDFHCFTGCSDSSECDTDYYCSITSFPSVDGASGRQCIPNNFMCTGGGASCVDDNLEDNDSLSAAKTITPGTQSLVSCPAATSGDDEDWFRVDVTADANVTVTISGGDVTDLDLTLTDSFGVLIDKGDTLTSDESVSSCLSPGTYYVRVYAFGIGTNPYSLTLSQTAGNCGAPMCIDDENEPDDNSSTARIVDLNIPPYLSTTQVMCSLDEDWFEVSLFNGETLHASLIFAQANGAEDLDLYLYDNSLVNLTGCSEATPLACDPVNGQSASDDEKMAWPITASGTYWVVVHGWAGSTNLYDICIGLSESDCPTP